MEVSFIAKYCLGLVSLAGVSSAAAVPLYSKFSKGNTKSPTHTINSSKVNESTTQISLEKCQDENLNSNSPIDFGTHSDNHLCGKVDPGNQELKNPEKYTDLFKKRGNDKGANGDKNNYQDQWQQQCDGSSNPWVILVSDGDKYLGLCDSTKWSDTIFIKKKNSDKLSFGACDKDCGETDSQLSTSGTTTLNKEKMNSGKEVKFYKKDELNTLKQQE